MGNLELMRRRLLYQGGVEQENRMIKDKFNTLQRALLYSYQAATVIKRQSYDEVLAAGSLSGEIEQSPRRALINPNKVKQDYDDKIISIPYEDGFGPGDIFEWAKTDTYWLIYLEELTEDAYFRGDIRRCRHQIHFLDDGKEYYTWAAIRGPVETQIDSIQKNQLRVDQTNLSLNILMPQNEKTLKLFNRYYKFMFAGRCWQVTAPDSISMRNIIEVNAVENYRDRDTDTMELKDGLVIAPIDKTPNSEIQGPTFIKPKIAEEYSVDVEGGKWCVVEKCPVKIAKVDETTVSVSWDKMTSGSFTLKWSKDGKEVTKYVVVESLL